ncbi:MAG: hypothetical protein AAF530_12395 [Pseudomonadota bacterium]
MEVKSAMHGIGASSSKTNDKTVAGVIVNTGFLSPERAQEISKRLGVPPPDRITVAVPEESLVQGLKKREALFEQYPLAKFALTPPAPLSIHTKQPTPGFTDQDIETVIGLTRAVSNFVVSHIWPNDVAKSVVKGCWLAYDAHNVIQSWDDPDVSTLSCLVDTSKVAFDALSLLDSTNLLGPGSLISESYKPVISDSLTIIGNMADGRDPTISSLDLLVKQNARELKEAGQDAELLQWDTYKLATKFTEAALSSDPKYKDFRLTPIPHFKKAD